MYAIIMHSSTKKPGVFLKMPGLFVWVDILRLKGSDVVPYSRFVSGGRIAVNNAFLGCFIDDGLRAIDQCFCFFFAICRQHFFDGSTQRRAHALVAEPGFFCLAQTFF